MAMFDNVKIGDLVLVSTSYSRNIATVERVSATQFVVDGVRYTKYGRKVGESRSVWSSTHIQFATPELIECVRAESAYHHARSTLCRLDNQLAHALRTVEQGPDKLKHTANLKEAAELLRQAVSALERLQELEKGNE